MTAKELTRLFLAAHEQGAGNAERLRYCIALRNAETTTALAHFTRLIGWVLRRRVAMIGQS